MKTSTFLVVVFCFILISTPPPFLFLITTPTSYIHGQPTAKVCLLRLPLHFWESRYKLHSSACVSSTQRGGLGKQLCFIQNSNRVLVLSICRGEETLEKSVVGEEWVAWGERRSWERASVRGAKEKWNDCCGSFEPDLPPVPRRPKRGKVTSTHRAAMDAWEEACRKIPDAKKFGKSLPSLKGVAEALKTQSPTYNCFLCVTIAILCTIPDVPALSRV